MQKVSLTNDILGNIKRMNEILSLSGNESKDYCKKNDIAIDSFYEEITIELDKYYIELCLFSGDDISPAFWAEVRLFDLNRDMLYHTEPLDDFNEFYVEDYDSEYGVTLTLDVENGCYNLEEDFDGC